MKYAYLLLFFISIRANAQDSERFIQNAQSVLAMNRSAQMTFFTSARRDHTRLHTTVASPRDYHMQAMVYIWKHDYEQAVVWLEKTASLYPKELGFVGETYLSSLHDYERALQHLTAYDALTPAVNDMIGNNPVSYLIGLAYRGLGNQPKAIEQFSIGIDSLAVKHGPEWVNYRHFISRAVSYLAVQQPEKALADLDNALKNFNRSALAQYYKGQALCQLNRQNEARTAFNDASFFIKALRVERKGDYQEDEANPLYEPEIDDALANLKL
ncbi:tetratricopeptide repeat protein [Spirosoma agri]|uniref:Tetratricopeptide repeat protein n=1 Tax=Spirosoma agri TaxID=1987381 RepID=A0A6M0IKZ3_9BACT|nr:tetratricopeptide repeat protein [Spirosoma agri]NEU68824.1 tetratricopeptide repeat protein [Spirosoma agri]